MNVLAAALAPLGEQALLYVFSEAREYVDALLNDQPLNEKQLDDFYLHLDHASRLDRA